MDIRGRIFASTLFTLFFAIAAFGQTMGSYAHNSAQMKLTTIPPLPTCARGSVQNGDPSKGPSVIAAKIATGCVIPWHWHTPNEHVMLVSGSARIEMKDAKPVTLTSGGYAMLESQHVHQFTCLLACQIFVYSDVAFDIHYVNKAGTEMTPAEAMKAVKETAATEMK